VVFFCFCVVFVVFFLVCVRVLVFVGGCLWGFFFFLGVGRGLVSLLGFFFVVFGLVWVCFFGLCLGLLVGVLGVFGFFWGFLFWVFVWGVVWVGVFFVFSGCLFFGFVFVRVFFFFFFLWVFFWVVCFFLLAVKPIHPAFPFAHLLIVMWRLNRPRLRPLHFFRSISLGDLQLTFPPPVAPPPQKSWILIPAVERFHTSMTPSRERRLASPPFFAHPPTN